ncbi:MAG: hypothetical protein AAF391_04750, partial [Bacteroidota bacterium]
SFVSTANDMSRFLMAIVKRDSSILQSESWELLFTKAFSNSELLSGYSLGLEEQLCGDITYWAKGGMLFGFLSQVVFFPDNSALFIAQNTINDDFLESFHKELRKTLCNKTSQNTTKSKQVNLERYAGEYRDARYDREGVENIISLFRGAFNVWSGEESLNVWHNGKLQSYVHQGDHVFVNTDNPDEKMVFLVDENGSISKLYRNVNIGGVYVPTTYEKTSWFNSPTFVNEYYGIVLIVIVMYGAISLFMMIVFLIRRWKSRFWKWSTLPFLYHLTAIASISIVITHIMKALLLLIRQTKEFLFGLPEEFVFYNSLGYLVPVFALLLWAALVQAILRKEGTLAGRIVYAIFAMAFTTHALFLSYWNFI